MNTLKTVDVRSAIAWRLVQDGDAETQDALAGAVARLSDEAISDLDSELQFFRERGFVGLLMSRLLSEISVASGHRAVA